MNSSNPFAGKLILVVDDEPRMIRFVQYNLELEGFRVIVAHNGLEAVEKVRTQLPDLVIMDVMMPEMDGFEALGLIREISDVPVIMLTVKNEDEDKHLAFSSGADDYLVKPFAFAELLARLRALLRRAGDTEPLKKQVGNLTLDVEQRRGHPAVTL